MILQGVCSESAERDGQGERKRSNCCKIHGTIHLKVLDSFGTIGHKVLDGSAW
jgi:hypothetical protein